MLELPRAALLLATDQDGVVSRRQLRGLGVGDGQVRSLLHHRRLVVVHPGVYVAHTGVPTWRQQAWAAVLWASPAALYGESALRLRGLGGGGGPVHVVVEAERSLQARPGVVVHRRRGMAAQVQECPGPPHQRLEEAVVDVALLRGESAGAVAVVSDAVGARLTTAGRLADALSGRARVRGRAFLSGVLSDVELGACSVLEQGYLSRVERPHGLPVGGRQVRASSRGTVYRDVDYGEQGLVVELDGRLHHSRLADRDRDLDRDLDAAVDGRLTVRLGWGQVFDRSCVTAVRLERLLRRLGWEGRLRPCPRCV